MGQVTMRSIDSEICFWMLLPPPTPPTGQVMPAPVVTVNVGGLPRGGSDNLRQFLFACLGKETKVDDEEEELPPCWSKSANSCSSPHCGEKNTKSRVITIKIVNLDVLFN